MKTAYKIITMVLALLSVLVVTVLGVSALYGDSKDQTVVVYQDDSEIFNYSGYCSVQKWFGKLVIRTSEICSDNTFEFNLNDNVTYTTTDW